LGAQIWLEWRRNGRAALAAWVVVFAVGVSSHHWVEAVLPHSLWQNLVALVLPVSWLFWIGIAGLNSARDANSGKASLCSFSALRPASTGLLLQAKLIASLATWLAGVGLFAGMQLCWAAQGGALHVSVDEEMLLFVISGNVLIGLLPLCVSGRLPGFPWSFIGLLAAGGIVGSAVVWWQDHPEWWNRLLPAVMLLLILKLAITALGFWRAIRTRIISSGFVFGAAAFWLLAVALLVKWRYVAGSPSDLGSARGLAPALLGTALTVPLARVALSPLALAMNRHR
jgi:hypothetical protein